MNAERGLNFKGVKNTPMSEGNKGKMLPLHTVLLFLLGTLSSWIFINFLPTYNWKVSTSWSLFSKEVSEISRRNVISPTYAIYGISKMEDHLVHVMNVLNRIGYRRVGLNDEWNLLWAHDYPFRSLPGLKNLKRGQMVNHLPGCGFLTNKVDLSTSRLPSLPRAFRLPLQKKQFLQFVKNNSQALFVSKHNEHRHIMIYNPESINLTSKDSFLQEFIQHPLLVDGYKFDIGVYVVITSIEPLRVYMYSGDVLFRYCPKQYYPFNASDVDKYVVGDDYRPIWQVPSLVKYISDFSGGMRDAFDAYMLNRNLDPSKIWSQIENILRETIVAKEPEIATFVKSYKMDNFFELMRFDFIVTNNLKVYLIEANMSPNMSSAHFKQNALLYEKILYSVFNLVGIRSLIMKANDMNAGVEDASEFITSEQDLASDLNTCAQFGCNKYCNISECSLCLPCLSGREYNMLKRAHVEHLHKVNMKRIFPKPITQLKNMDIIAETENMSVRNAWMTRWFYSRCLRDISWCH